MTTALIGDLSALYFAAKQALKNRNLDYITLNKYLKENAGIDNWDFTLLFTLFDPGNQSQINFIKFLKDEINWNIDAVDVSQVSQKYRFDCRIAFSLGKLMNKYDQFVIMANSYSLAEPILEMCERDTKISVAFFNDYLDDRWFRKLFYDDRVGFIDLHEMGGKEYNPQRSGLKHLP